MGSRERVRVEFSLTPALANIVYEYAKSQDLTLSQAGERLLAAGLTHADSPELPTGRAKPEEVALRSE